MRRTNNYYVFGRTCLVTVGLSMWLNNGSVNGKFFPECPGRCVLCQCRLLQSGAARRSTQTDAGLLADFSAYEFFSFQFFSHFIFFILLF